MLEGLVLGNRDLMLLADETVVVRSDLESHRRSGRVSLISGGGSGHEPAHGGYVGEGLLTAAVAGEVFTSPSVDAVLAAIRAVTGPAGTLLIVKNYTGDRLNFGLAAEIARSEGLLVEMTIVDDDVALNDDVSFAGRRGIAGTVLVHKVAGAAAAAGLPLADVKHEAERAVAQMGTMGIALGPCTVPAAGRPGFDLGADEIELGLGIHGEPGVRRARLQPADVLVEEVCRRILAVKQIGSGARVVVLVNNLGGTPPMELAILTRAALRLLNARGVIVERILTGSFLTAIEMPGFSITLFVVDDRRLERICAEARAAADGALIAQGGWLIGWGLYVIEGKPQFIYKATGQARDMLRLASSDTLAPGPHEIAVQFTYDGGGVGKGGQARLLVDGVEVSSGRIERTFGALMPNEGGASIGRDYGTTLTNDYRSPFVYPGKIEKVTIDLLD
jgi:dihydroxyacetone kinase